ncbi:hypothetical protein PINS_up019559 [Pythium insidiosum]|nr:hypothetical protein PINS_up019559 [Pythium insidiosum]
MLWHWELFALDPQKYLAQEFSARRSPVSNHFRAQMRSTQRVEQAIPRDWGPVVLLAIVRNRLDAWFWYHVLESGGYEDLRTASRSNGSQKPEYQQYPVD